MSEPGRQPVAEAGAEARTAPRFSLLIRTAKLVGPTGEYLCVVRDVSATGLKVRTFHALPAARELILEMPNGDRYPVERVWESADHAGFRFAEAVPVEYLLQDEGQYRKRPLRLRMDLPALVVAGGVAAPATVRDLSQQGARIECAAFLAIDQQVRLEIAGVPQVYAKVRWRRPPAAGLVFEQTFRLEEFARLAAALQPVAAQPASCGDSPALRSA